VLGTGFLGSHDPRVHFGLGSATEAEVEVKWLDGTRRRLTTHADQVLGIARP
jgi:hypothetical protein